MHYSTKWMGVDKSAIIVLELKKCPMLERRWRLSLKRRQEGLEAERLMSLMPGSSAKGSSD